MLMSAYQRMRRTRPGKIEVSELIQFICLQILQIEGDSSVDLNIPKIDKNVGSTVS